MPIKPLRTSWLVASCQKSTIRLNGPRVHRAKLALFNSSCMSKHELQAELSEEEFGKLVEVHLKGRKREIEMLGGLIGTMIHS